MSGSMGKRKSVPDDLMGTILSESFDAADDEKAPSESRESPDAVVYWDEKAERVGIAFNLSKQLSVELEKLRWELRAEEDIRPSKSEIAEVALRIAVEDVRERGAESELSRRLYERRVAQISDTAAGTTQRSVDESGWIFETTYDENGAIIDENVVCTVADLPVTDEYVDEQGRLVSVAKDELGNTFEQIMDEAFNTLGTRLLRTSDQEAR
jgi:YD repeat-containing protein